MSNKISVSDYKKMVGTRRMKYGNVISVYSGKEFDSRKEMNRYLELFLRQKNKEIKNLERQKSFPLLPKQKDERPVVYKSDFYYFDNFTDQWIVEDVKSEITKKISTYIIKRKLFKFKYSDIVFIET